MKLLVSISVVFLSITLSIVSRVSAQDSIQTIADYNSKLPFWGVTWKPGANNENGYHPSFYTGFAIRSEVPERIHVRLSRGNQTRVSVIIDDKTLNDYLFHLVKRNEFYKQLTDESSGVLTVTPSGGEVLPQLQYFGQILESSNYGVAAFVQRANSSSLPAEVVYAKSLEVLTALNPGRVFNLNLNLTNEFKKWKQGLQKRLVGVTDIEAFYKSKPTEVVIALDTLLWGRINVVEAPSEEVLQKLVAATTAALSNAPDAELVSSALDLFKAVTKSKYDFLVLKNGRLAPALQCTSANSCFLSYPEFTAIYPTGSVKAKISDSYGNKIPLFRTPGLWNFLSRSYHEVDHIRNEPYYGWAPKMDYEAVGNGYHNPAVRFGAHNGFNQAVKDAIGSSSTHTTFWSVMRGGVSHGCSRLPLGHVWEMRYIFPTENKNMVQVQYFGNMPTDFDLFDVDGDSDLEVMGVEYAISYELQDESGLGRREGKDIQLSTEGRRAFYDNLYGTTNVFTASGDNYLFQNPSVSFQSYLDLSKLKVSTRMTVEGEFPLFEQKYEQDKVQLYAPKSSKLNGRDLRNTLVRLLGRVKGCAPSADKASCGEQAFDTEAKSFLPKVK